MHLSLDLDQDLEHPALYTPLHAQSVAVGEGGWVWVSCPRIRTHPLDLRGVSGQAGGQGAGAVAVVVEPADLLAQHGAETQPP